MRTFLIVWLGQFISQTGGRLSGFALGVWVYQQTGSATLFALITTFALLPGVLAGPIAGLVADRVDRRLVMIVADSGAALCTLAVAVLLALGRLELWQIYLTQGLAAAFSAFQAPAFAAAVTQLVPREQLGRAAGLNQLADGLSLVLAAPLAGLLLGVIGLAGIVALDLISFAFAVLTLLLVRFPSLLASAEPAGGGGWGKLLHDASAGLRYNLARPGLLGINLVSAAIGLSTGIVSALLTPMVLAFATAGAAGAVSGILGLGSVAGSVLISAWRGPRRRVFGLLGYGLLHGLFVAAAGLRPSAPLVSAMMFLAFCGVPVASVCSSLIWRTKVPLEMQGRIFALNRMVVTLALVLGVGLAGPLADGLFEPLMAAGGPLAGSVGQLIGVGPGRGIGLLFIVTGALVMLATAAGWLSPRIRRVEEELPDALPAGSGAVT
jgi:DHA3 family macrolide efflux protein-like MFS transporter